MSETIYKSIKFKKDNANGELHESGFHFFSIFGVRLDDSLELISEGSVDLFDLYYDNISLRMEIEEGSDYITLWSTDRWFVVDPSRIYSTFYYKLVPKTREGENMTKKVEQVDTFPPKDDMIETAYADDQIKEALCEMTNIYNGNHELIDQWPACDAMTDQTIKADAGKPKISMVPREAVEAIAKIFMYGETKYPKNSWRDVPVERYSDAGLRHWFKYAEDPHGMDLESGWPHCWHMLWNAAAVVAKEEPYFRERLGIIDWDD